MILCEKVYAAAFAHDKHFFQVANFDARRGNITIGSGALWKAVVDKLHRNPASVSDVIGLHAEYRGIHKREILGTVLDGDQPTVDTFEVYEVVALNAYSCPTPSANQVKTEFGFRNLDSKHSSGLWVCTSYMNHACVANSQQFFMGDLVVLRATKPIAKGEEVRAPYGSYGGYDDRQAHLQQN